MKCPAKVNLCLDILGRDLASGYHFVDTIMAVIPDLFDEIEISRLDNRLIRISSNDPDLPCDETNTCFRAARLLLNGKQGLHIHITKNIPLASGLGGGSSNAAATLLLINEMFQLGYSKSQLADIAVEIGVDVPFFIYGGTCYCTHFGELVEPLPHLSGLHFSIEHSPADTQSTRLAYNRINITKTGKKHEQTLLLKQKILLGEDINTMFTLMHNDFELLTTRNELISRNRQKQLKKGAKRAILAGSGNAIVGIF